MGIFSNGAFELLELPLTYGRKTLASRLLNRCVIYLYHVM